MPHNPTSGGSKNAFCFRFLVRKGSRFLDVHVQRSFVVRGMSRARSNFTVFFYVRILSFVLTIVRHNPLAYNINFLNAEVFRDPSRASSSERRSYFGFSVALYANAKESLVLVGAPRANSSALPLVTEPGTVFKCAPNNTCKEWVIDKTGNGRYSYDKLNVNQIKDNAWIGATIVAGKNKEAARIVVRSRFFFKYQQN